MYDTALRTLLALLATLLLGAFLVLRRKLTTRKPVLAVDYDEVCVGYLPAFIEFCNATRGTKLKLEDFHSYMFWEVEGCKLATREEATACVYAFHASPYFDKIVPIDGECGTCGALRALATKYELHVVTSRQTDIADKTRAHIEKHFPGVFTGVHFGNHFGLEGKKVSKPEMCARIGAVALIDDSLDYARQLAKAGTRTYLFGDYGWNRGGEVLVSPRLERHGILRDVPEPLISRAAGWGPLLNELLYTSGNVNMPDESPWSNNPVKFQRGIEGKWVQPAKDGI